MRNIFKKIVEKIKTHILCSVTFFSQNRTVYEIMSKNVVEPERTQTIWRQRVIYIISEQAHACAHTPTPTHSLTQTHTRAHGRTHAHACRNPCARTPPTHTHTHTHTQKYIILIAFHGNGGFVNTPQWYVTSTIHCLSC